MENCIAKEPAAIMALRPSLLWRTDGPVYFWYLRYRMLDIMYNTDGLDIGVSNNAKSQQ